MTENPVAYETRTPLSFEEALKRCHDELAREGFGVLSTIDIQGKLKEKLGVAVEPNVILGACHPPSALRALEVAPEVGVLLPCNVTVSVEAGETTIRAMRPDSVMAVLGRDELRELGAEVGAKLERVVRALGAAGSV